MCSVFLIWTENSGEAFPPLHKLLARQGVAVIKGRVSEIDVIAAAADYDEEMTTRVAIWREADDDGFAMIGYIDDIVEG